MRVVEGGWVVWNTLKRMLRRAQPHQEANISLGGGHCHASLKWLSSRVAGIAGESLDASITHQSHREGAIDSIGPLCSGPFLLHS